MLQSTKIDPLEDHPVLTLGEDDSPYQRRVFGECQVERQRIIDACLAARTGPLLRVACKLVGCCRSPMILTDARDENLRLSERRCRSRCCPRCRRFRSREVQHRLLAAVKKMDARRFLTLTLKSTDEPLVDQLAHLRKSFARLRRQSFWREAVTGGVYTIEVTFNPVTRQWHPHLHAIIDGSYVRKNDLVDGWTDASGGSFIVDIRRVDSASSVASYIAKYVAKSDDASKIPDPALAEWATSIHAMRLVHTFGNLHGVALVDKPESVPGVNVDLVNPSTLVAAAESGDQAAARLLQTIEYVSHGGGIEEQSSAVKRIRTWQRWCEIERRVEAMRERPPPSNPARGTLWLD